MTAREVRAHILLPLPTTTGSISTKQWSGARTYKCNNVVNKCDISAVLAATARITGLPIKHRLITKHNKPWKQLAKIPRLVFKKTNRAIPLIQLSEGYGEKNRVLAYIMRNVWRTGEPVIIHY